jgi:hypothetical protein
MKHATNISFHVMFNTPRLDAFKFSIKSRNISGAGLTSDRHLRKG